MRLIPKVILSVSAVLLVVMGPFAYLNIVAIQRLLHEEAVSAADNISETIIKTTHYQMLEDDRERVYQMIQEAGKQEGIEHIRMIAKDGTIIFSADRSEVGAQVDKSASACDMCHSGQRPLREAPSMSRSRVFPGPDGREVLGITKPIYNQPACSAAPCHFHPADQQILGVLDTVVSLEPMRAQTRQYVQRLALLGLAMLLVVGTALVLLIQGLIHRPLRDILQHIGKVGELDLRSRLEVRTRDELGELAAAFNEMIGKLADAKEELEGWARTLESKVDERTRELRQAQEQLVRSEKLASLGKLVAGIAHELNNPITGILMLASYLEEDEDADPERREDLRRIAEESQRCATIVRGLLDFARESVPRKEAVDVHSVLDRALGLLATQAIFQDVAIVRRYAPDLPAVLADPHQLGQVFVNLLLNAGQAMPAGGTLTVETAETDGAVAVCIRDTGCGISERDLGRIFDPFFTTKDGDGTGLGLSVSYGIVENHGGTIQVRSRPGEGSAFTVRLPTADRMEEDVSARP
ncbi:MAG: ATP-binding protein [Deferrisomatales bacterium]